MKKGKRYLRVPRKTLKHIDRMIEKHPRKFPDRKSFVSYAIKDFLDKVKA